MAGSKMMSTDAPALGSSRLRLEYAAAAAALALVLWTAALPALLGVDVWVNQWIQLHWSEPMRIVARSLGTVVEALLIGLLALVLLTGRLARRSQVIAGALAVAGGAIVSEVLKTAIERFRPDAAPGMVAANSFPSGHVVVTAVAALALLRLVRRCRWPRGVKVAAAVVAVGAVALQAVARLLLGAHWITDVIASLLLAIVWVLGTPAMMLVPRRVSVPVLLSLTAFFAAVYYDASLRFHLPSASDDRPALASLDLGRAAEARRLPSPWVYGGVEPIGPVAWLASPRATVSLDSGDGQPTEIEIVMRPATCGVENRNLDSRLAFSVNGWRVPSVKLRRGWRAYRFQLPADAWRTGKDSVGFEVLTSTPGCRGTPDPGLIAFRTLRVLPRIDSRSMRFAAR
jgi:membrane-associated phospholipid phosphatase